MSDAGSTGRQRARLVRFPPIVQLANGWRQTKWTARFPHAVPSTLTLELPREVPSGVVVVPWVLESGNVVEFHLYAMPESEDIGVAIVSLLLQQLSEVAGRATVDGLDDHPMLWIGRS